VSSRLKKPIERSSNFKHTNKNVKSPFNPKKVMTNKLPLIVNSINEAARGGQKKETNLG